MVAAGLQVHALWSLFGLLLALALVPGVSVMAVVSRTMALGAWQGIQVTLGIIAGDMVYIAVAVFGLSAVIAMLGESHLWLRYLGGVYLILLGLMLWRRRGNATGKLRIPYGARLSGFVTGFLLTLGDQKAILFYLGLFPALFDLTRMSLLDVVSVMWVAMLSIGLGKLVYVYMALKLRTTLPAGVADGVRIVAAVAMVATGLYVLSGL